MSDPLNDVVRILAIREAQRLRTQQRGGDHEADMSGVLGVMIRIVGDRGVEGKGVREELVAAPELVPVVVDTVLLPLTPPLFDPPGTGARCCGSRC